MTTYARAILLIAGLFGAGSVSCSSSEFVEDDDMTGGSGGTTSASGGATALGGSGGSTTAVCPDSSSPCATLQCSDGDPVVIPGSDGCCTCQPLCPDLSSDLTSFLEASLLGSMSNTCTTATDCQALAVEAPCGSACSIVLSANAVQSLQASVNDWVLSSCPAGCARVGTKCPTQSILVRCESNVCVAAR